MTRRPLAIAAAMAMLACNGAASAQDKGAIAGYGRVTPLPDAANQPDSALRYRVVFDVTKAADGPDKINPTLDRVARFVNLLATRGITPQPGDIVAVVHGPATLAILSDAAHRTRNKMDNPNIPLIHALKAAGVEVHVCGQALHGMGFTGADLAPGVVEDLSALTTVTTLQLKGWALVP